MGGLLGDVLGQPARSGARGQDALDGAALEGSEGAGVRKRRAEVGGAVALAKQQDLARVIAGETALGSAQAGEEEGPGLADAGEGLLELVKVGGGPAPGLVGARGRHVAAGPAGSQLVPRHELEVGGVDEDLGLGHAYRQDVGDVVVGDGVAVAVEGYEAVDAAYAVDDTGGVVRVGG